MVVRRCYWLSELVHLVKIIIRNIGFSSHQVSPQATGQPGGVSFLDHPLPSIDNLNREWGKLPEVCTALLDWNDHVVHIYSQTYTIVTTVIVIIIIFICYYYSSCMLMQFLFVNHTLSLIAHCYLTVFSQFWVVEHLLSGNYNSSCDRRTEHCCVIWVT